MYKHNGLAPVEFFENWEKSRVAQPVGVGVVFIAGKEANAVRLKHVERILDFKQGGFRIGKWYRGEKTKTSGVAPRQVGSILIAFPCRAAGSLRIAEPDPRHRDREDRSRDALGIHRVERLLRFPLVPHRIFGHAVAVFDGTAGYKMVMDID